MFDLPKPFRAKLEGLKLVVRETGPVTARFIRFKLGLALDPTLAQGLGPNGMVAWSKVRDGTLHKVEMEIDRIRAKVLLAGVGSKLTLDGVKGVKAVFTAGPEPAEETDEDSDPIVTVEWEASFVDEPWVFLGRNAKGYVDVALQRQNPELPNLNAPPATPPPARKPNAAEDARLASVLPFTVTVAAPPPSPWDEDGDEAQLAETPEEAEAMRAERLATEQDEPEDEPAPPPDAPDPSAVADTDEGLAF